MDEAALQALPALPETEHPLAEVPITPELEEFLWEYHMRMGALMDCAD